MTWVKRVLPQGGRLRHRDFMGKYAENGVIKQRVMDGGYLEVTKGQLITLEPPK